MAAGGNLPTFTRMEELATEDLNHTAVMSVVLIVFPISFSSAKDFIPLLLNEKHSWLYRPKSDTTTDHLGFWNI